MANSSTRRTVAHPGVNTGSGSNFQSPFQPPPAVPDLEGDLSLLDPSGYSLVHVDDYFWRVRVPGPEALKEVANLPQSGGAQLMAIGTFLQRYLHPDDFRRAIQCLLDPDSSFTGEHYYELYRAAVTVGTARPFRQFSDLPGPQLTAGALSGQNWLSVAYRHR